MHLLTTIRFEIDLFAAVGGRFSDREFEIHNLQSWGGCVSAWHGKFNNFEELSRIANSGFSWKLWKIANSEILAHGPSWAPWATLTIIFWLQIELYSGHIPKIRLKSKSNHIREPRMVAHVF